MALVNIKFVTTYPATYSKAVIRGGKVCVDEKDKVTESFTVERTMEEEREYNRKNRLLIV